jgi:predicted glycosyltransferase
MRVLVTVQHPAHVHFYRHVIGALSERGHQVHVVARENDLAVPLLERYSIPHEVLAGPQDSLFGLAKVQLTYEYRLWRAASRFDPDVVTAIGGVAAAHVAPLVGARSVVFVDNEGAFSHRLMAPFAHVICTPQLFEDDYGDKHVRYDGYQELAYLHPDRFDSPPRRLRRYGLDPDERYFLLRVRKWDALHDVGEFGLSLEGKRRLVSLLERYGEVYVTSTDELPPELADYRLPVPPHLVHDLLYHADIYAGDSGTMATEAAVLGTPGVRVQSVAARGLSNFVELEERYRLLRSTPDENEAFEYVRELVTDPTIAETWRRRRTRLLDEKIDVAAFVTDLLCEQVKDPNAPVETTSS